MKNGSCSLYSYSSFTDCLKWWWYIIIKGHKQVSPPGGFEDFGYVILYSNDPKFAWCLFSRFLAFNRVSQMEKNFALLSMKVFFGRKKKSSLRACPSTPVHLQKFLDFAARRRTCFKRACHLLCAKGIKYPLQFFFFF